MRWVTWRSTSAWRYLEQRAEQRALTRGVVIVVPAGPRRPPPPYMSGSLRTSTRPTLNFLLRLAGGSVRTRKHSNGDTSRSMLHE